MLSQKELLSEFLFDRVALASILPFERFKRLFPKGSSEATVREIYDHLKKKDYTTRRSLKVSLDNNEFFNEYLHGISRTKDDLSVEKLLKNLESLTIILSIELNKLSEEYNTELQNLRLEVMDLNNIAFGANSEKEGSSIEELTKSIKSLQE